MIYPFLAMLNVAAFRILSDPDRVPTFTLRLFLRLICDCDLTVWRVLNVHRLVEAYSLSRVEVLKSIATLVALGLLEEGPKLKRGRFNSYRIRPGYLLSPDDLREFFRETAERRERETMQPLQ